MSADNLPQNKIQRALIAVYDKYAITDFARELVSFGVEILSTGGTAKCLKEAGIPVTEVSSVTEFPEIMGGRVKSLHPKIHGGILARRDLAEDRQAMEEHGISPIDLVVINLYPFEDTIASGASYAEAIEQIDIGGPAMIRAAAKNHAHVGVVVDPSCYGDILQELRDNQGSLPLQTRKKLAAQAFSRTFEYDQHISNYLSAQASEEASDSDSLFGPIFSESWTKHSDMRYGENPHQSAACYAREDGGNFSIAKCETSGKKALSYNNLLDASAAIECMRGLKGPAAVVVKHCLPCGAAQGKDLATAYERAVAGDPLSAFGGILALSDTLTADLAKQIAVKERFFEVIYAPVIEAEAVQAIEEGVRWGKNCRLIQGGITEGSDKCMELRSLPGAVLVQERDVSQLQESDFKVVSKKQPSAAELEDIYVAWKIIPHVRSNAILLVKDGEITGVGAGQPSRVDAVKIACSKAGEKAKGSVLASDAFFPFADGLEEGIRCGIGAVVQPGGSVRDKEVIAAADEAGIVLIHTGERHFKH